MAPSALLSSTKHVLKPNGSGRDLRARAKGPLWVLRHERRRYDGAQRPGSCTACIAMERGRPIDLPNRHQLPYISGLAGEGRDRKDRDPGPAGKSGSQ